MPPQKEDRSNPAVSADSATQKQLDTSSIQVDNNVYNAESLAKFHPGGELFVKVFAGRDATEAFLSYHRKPFPHSKVTDHLVGNNVAAKEKGSDAEFLELCQIVEEALPRSKAFAPLSYYVKVAVLLGLAGSLEYYIHHNRAYDWYLTGFLGWIFALIGLNIQHDANHGAISRTALVNRLLGLTQNWIGGSAVDWIHQHVVQHHINPNDEEHDPDIVGNIALRLNPTRPMKPSMLYQHIYVFLMLFLFGFTYIFGSLGHLMEGVHFTRFSSLVASNRIFEQGTVVFFLFRWLVLPVYLNCYAYASESIAVTLANVVPLFVVGGFYLSFFFLISHNFEGVAIYQSGYLSKVEPSFLRKQVATGSNVGGAWLCFLNGGLNYQIEHHLFPRIQHSHYPTIAPIVRKYCEAKGIPYRHFPTLADNVASCARHLYQMGHEQTPAGYKTCKKQN